MSHNPGLRFYKRYYENFDFKLLLDENKEILKKKTEEWKKEPTSNPFYLGNKELYDFTIVQGQVFQQEINGLGSFKLTTTYPGLLVGTGYTHGSGVLGEFKIGFFFDHTTGLPTIPGSSIKGLIRSAFPGLYAEKAQEYKDKSKEKEANKWTKLAGGREKFILTLLEKLEYALPDGKTVYHLEKEIFEGLTWSHFHGHTVKLEKYSSSNLSGQRYPSAECLLFEL